MLEQAPPSAAGAPVTCQGATADSRDKLNTLVESRPRLEMLKILFFFFSCVFVKQVQFGLVQGGTS